MYVCMCIYIVLKLAECCAFGLKVKCLSPYPSTDHVYNQK